MKTMEKQYPVTDGCEALGVSRSGYYAWRGRVPPLRTEANRELVIEIVAMFEARQRRYGSPRITRDLRKRGRACGENRVARLMRQKGLDATPKRRFRVMTTQSNHDLPIAPNRLAEAQKSTAPNQRWVSDITYVSTEEGWLYVAGILDAYSRRIVGWSLREQMTSELVIDALRMAWFLGGADVALEEGTPELPRPERSESSAPGAVQRRRRKLASG